MRNYIRDLFAHRFERHKIRVECTEAFLQVEVECYPSTLLPALINIVDNAVYWMSSLQSDRVLTLDVENHALIIANNGPTIEERDRARIFERGFSRKPGGRGLGLFISYRALEAENMHLVVETSAGQSGTQFRIEVPKLVHTKS